MGQGFSTRSILISSYLETFYKPGHSSYKCILLYLLFVILIISLFGHLNTAEDKNLSVNSSLAPFKTASDVPVESEPGA